MIARGLPLVPDGAVLVANGKQALSLVAQDLRERSVRTVIAPGYHCLAMIEPFQLEGLRVTFVPVDGSGLMDAAALRSALANQVNVALLHSQNFGLHAGAHLRAVLDDARSHGVPVVVDATHALFSSVRDAGDYEVASLRKLLPVPEGAYVTGLPTSRVMPRDAEAERIVSLGQAVVELRHGLLEGLVSPRDAVAAFDALEAAMLEARVPVAMHAQTRHMLVGFDHATARVARWENARFVMARMADAGVGVLNAASAASGVTIVVDDADAVERALLGLGIVCPWGWPRPAGLAADAAWPTGWVTLPVDPDLPRTLLTEMAAVVARVVAGTR